MITFPPPFWSEYHRHREEIADMLDQRCHTIEWLDTQLLSGDVLAFGNATSVIIITVKAYPAGATELHGLAAAGELDGILALIEEAEKWGARAGITFACISSRPAWARVLKNKGYAVKRVELAKDLNDGA